MQTMNQSTAPSRDGVSPYSHMARLTLTRLAVVTQKAMLAEGNADARMALEAQRNHYVDELARRAAGRTFAMRTVSDDMLVMTLRKRVRGVCVGVDRIERAPVMPLAELGLFGGLSVVCEAIAHDTGEAVDARFYPQFQAVAFLGLAQVEWMDE